MKSLLKIQTIYLLPFLLLLVHRVNGQDFEVAPVRLEFNAEPGDNQMKVINVKNHSNKSTSFIISIGDFLPTGDGDKKQLAPNSTKRSCANWLNINPTFFELNPGDETQIKVGILVPNDEFSDAWCMLYFQQTKEQTSWNADKNLEAGVVISGKIGVQIYQSPKSNANKAIKISNLAEVANEDGRNRKFTATIENLGDKVTKCKVYLIASDMKTAEEKQFAAIEIETFPKMSRAIELKLPNMLKSGTYSLAAIVDYGSKFALEGTQIIIEVKDQNETIKPDTTVVKSDTAKAR